METSSAWGQVVAMSPWEYCAVILGITYLVLAARENIWCWACALISTCIYTVLFWNESLLMESALNVYYIGMAFYGWRQWGRIQNLPQLKISSWKPSKHFFAILLVLVLTTVSGTLLSKYTSAVWPYVDSFTTWGAVITTWMVANKILENWLYWIVVDGVSIPLYLERGLYLTAGLFAIYLVIVVIGYFTWLKEYREYSDEPSPA